jgi:hypothetical protein
MSDSAEDEFIGSVDPRFAPIVGAIHLAVVDAAPALNRRISYRMLTYTLGQDLRNWVCAIGVTRKAVCLRFLFGTFLSDPRGLLRAGTSILSTMDFTTVDQVDESVIAEYVHEAVSRHAEFKAKSREKQAQD